LDNVEKYWKGRAIYIGVIKCVILRLVVRSGVSDNRQLSCREYLRLRREEQTRRLK
jgi:hypothetical protein